MNSYKKLFDQISPSESDEQLINKVLARKAENMKDNDTKNTKATKKFFLKKAVIIPTAAALALGAATLSVGAANNWDYSNPFKNMFAQKYEGNVNVNSDVHSVVLPTSAPTSGIASQGTSSVVEKVDYTPERPIGTFDFEKYGKPLDIVMDGDGVTATLNGMLAYDDMCYIMYTLTATDEAIARSGGLVPGLRIDFGNWGFKIDGKRAGGMGYGTDTISEEGNTRIGYIKVEYDHVDLAGKTLNITFLSQTNSGPVLLKEEKDILVDFPIAEKVEKELDLDLKTDMFEGKINKITVGGFRANFSFVGKLIAELPKEEIEVETDSGIKIVKIPDDHAILDEVKEFGNAVLTLKDGTTVVAKYDGHGTYGHDGIIEGEIRLEYTYPINPSDVVSITYNDWTINF